MQTQYELQADAQWSNIQEYLPLERRRMYDLRNVVDGILWLFRTVVNGEIYLRNFCHGRAYIITFELGKIMVRSNV